MERQRIEKGKLGRNIDYIKIVDELSEDAFSFCVAHIYPLYNYRVLKIEEMRRVDLKENLLRINSWLPNDVKAKGTLFSYVSMLDTYLQRIECVPDSLAQRLKERGNNAKEKAIKFDGTIEDLDDLFYVFLSLEDAWKNTSKIHSKRIVETVKTDFTTHDAAMFKELLLDKRAGEILNGKKGLLGGKLPDRKVLEFFYVNNIIFLARALDYLGAIEGEEA